MTNLTLAKNEFLETVRSLKPQVAAFDCDGTLWSGDAGEGFCAWSMQQGMVSKDVERKIRSRYADYKAGNVAEEVMCGEIITMYEGLREEEVQRATDEYFVYGIAPGIFPEMRELVHDLRRAGTEVWAVSSSSQWVIRSAMHLFDIPIDHVLAAEAAVKNGVIQGRMLRVPSGPGKPEALRTVLNSPPECAFGNSVWDRELLEMVKHPFAINPSPKLKEIALASSWTIYQP